MNSKGATEVMFGSDTDFQRFWDNYVKRFNKQMNQADALIKLGNEL